MRPESAECSNLAIPSDYEHRDDSIGSECLLMTPLEEGQGHSANIPVGWPSVRPRWLNGAAPESNRPSVGLPRRTGFEGLRSERQ